ncbi:MAG TPA: hypothetical protein DDW19_03330 [Anaerolineaceae bacterium]|jgi:hypothetical protein|nr:hypothetical protein [Anaerolineaceae bacterium]
MTTDQIVTLIVAIVGSGALGILINSIATKKKVRAESGKITSEAHAIDQDSINKTLESIAKAADLISDVSGQQVKMLYEQVSRQEKRIAELEDEIRILRDKTKADDMTIATLQKENSRLKDQVKKLVDENTAKDRVIDDLKRRVDELETKLSTVESAEKRRQDCE